MKAINNINISLNIEYQFQLQVGAWNDAQGQLCENGFETHDHLFYRCNYAVQILRKVKSWLSIKYTDEGYERLIMFIDHSKRTRFR